MVDMVAEFSACRSLDGDDTVTVQGLFGPICTVDAKVGDTEARWRMATRISAGLLMGNRTGRELIVMGNRQQAMNAGCGSDGRHRDDPLVLFYWDDGGHPDRLRGLTVDRVIISTPFLKPKTLEQINAYVVRGDTKVIHLWR